MQTNLDTLEPSPPPSALDLFNEAQANLTALLKRKPAGTVAHVCASVFRGTFFIYKGVMRCTTGGAIYEKENIRLSESLSKSDYEDLDDAALELITEAINKFLASPEQNFA